MNWGGGGGQGGRSGCEGNIQVGGGGGRVGLIRL